MTKKIPYSQFKHGQRCTCEIDGKKVTDARIHIDPDGDVYIVQEGKDRICVSSDKGTYFDSSKEEDYFVTNLTLLPRTIEDVEEGDIIVSLDNKYGRKVLGRCGTVIMVSCYNEFDKYFGTYSIQDFIGFGYTIKQDTPPEDDIDLLQSVAQVAINEALYEFNKTHFPYVATLTTDIKISCIKQ